MVSLWQKLSEVFSPHFRTIENLLEAAIYLLKLLRARQVERFLFHLLTAFGHLVREWYKNGRLRKKNYCQQQVARKKRDDDKKL